MQENKMIAVISDIHGNRWALEAVLKDIKNRGVDKILNLGDSMYGPLDPGGTIKILMNLELPSVSGNQDRFLLGEGEFHTFKYVKQEIGENGLSYIKTLKTTDVFENEFFMCHGTPENDDEYLLHEIQGDRVRMRRKEEISSRLHGVKQPVVLCGHDHTPNLVSISDEQIVVNPGSVGLGAYIDEEPSVHAMETGSPHARYSLVYKDFFVQNIALPYDWRKAAACAAKNNRPDWVKWLLEGQV